MKVLVTGGTGTVGSSLVHELLGRPEVKRVRVMGRSESRTLAFKANAPDDPRLEIVSADVTDLRSMQFHCRGMDVVFHAAAMKHVDLIELDPHVAISVNIEGTRNLVDSALGAEVKRFVLMSTDKVVHSSSLYGATKLVAEKLVMTANRVAPVFNIFRSGNVVNSNGSVLEVWREQLARTGRIVLTDPRMTRFYISSQQMAKQLAAMPQRDAGTVFVPFCKAFRLSDLAHSFLQDARRPDAGRDVVGPRPGEKLHEELISSEELRRTSKAKDGYVVHAGAVRNPLGRIPSSNDKLVTRQELLRLLKGP